MKWEDHVLPDGLSLTFSLAISWNNKLGAYSVDLLSFQGELKRALTGMNTLQIDKEHYPHLRGKSMLWLNYYKRKSVNLFNANLAINAFNANCSQIRELSFMKMMWWFIAIEI